MCLELSIQRVGENTDGLKVLKARSNNSTARKDQMLSSNVMAQAFPQTILIMLINSSGRHQGCALIGSGSQRS